MTYTIAQMQEARKITEGAEARITKLANRLNPLNITNATREIVSWEIDGVNVRVRVSDRWQGDGDNWSFSFPTYLLANSVAVD